MKLSIIMCFHNSELKLPLFFDYLQKLKVDGLIVQWIFVDNLSSDNTNNLLITNATVLTGEKLFISETKLGLLYARVTGICESDGDLLFFFDDDTYPDENYLLNAVQVFSNNKNLIGLGGKCLPYQLNIPKWLYPLQGLLALRDHKSEMFFKFDLRKGRFLPWGAGMVLDGFKVREASKKIREDNLWNFGRQGLDLASGEDTLLVGLTAGNDGIVGYSPKLSLLHNIGENRLTLDYLFRLSFNLGLSGVYIFNFFAANHDKSLIQNCTCYFSKFKILTRIILDSFFAIFLNDKRALIHLQLLIVEIFKLIQLKNKTL